MNRRSFLAGSAAATGLLLSGRAWGQWGRTPELASDLLLGDGVRAEKVLEVFLYGGMSPWESFYTVPDGNRPGSEFGNQQWQLFRNQHGSIYNRCGVPADQLTQPFALDSNGADVHLGPHAWPLRQRADLLSRLRVVVMRHDLEPHEAAIPYALSGMRLGSPRMVGMGGHIQRYWLERQARTEPYAYVLQPENIIGTDNTRAADAIGLHPGSARPLALKIASSQSFLNQLERANVGDRKAAFDALVQHYSTRTDKRYRTRLGDPLRSAGLADHASAFNSIRNAPVIREVLGENFMAAMTENACNESNNQAFTTMGLQAATELLTHPTAPARYVNVVDTGLYEADGGGGYDTHGDHLGPQARNTTAMLKSLVARINEPGEADPNKIDLDDTMVVITTEFGRTPFAQDGGSGTNHHPYGYINLILGGPIGPEQAGLAGAIGADGTATEWASPPELRAALLAACGIYPFTHESFAVGDVRDVVTERDAMARVQELILGRPA